MNAKSKLNMKFTKITLQNLRPNNFEQVAKKQKAAKKHAYSVNTNTLKANIHSGKLQSV